MGVNDEAMAAVLGVAAIRGRVTVTSARREDVFWTEVTIPAPDEYSMPGILEIRSRVSLGRKGDDIEGRVRLGGYRRKAYQFTDKETGEQRTVRPVVNVLDWCE